MFARVLTTLIGTLLLFAAALKAIGTPSVAPTLLGGGAWLHLATVQFELFLGLWLISGLHAMAAWTVAVLTFFFFAVISLNGVLIGQADCGCFGNLPVRSWQALLLDSGILILLAWVRPSLQLSKVVAPASLFALNFAMVLGIWTAYLFAAGHSTSFALAGFRGEPLVAEPSILDYGSQPPRTQASASVTVSNLSTRAITLVGGSSDCSCTAVDDLPLTLQAGESRSVTIQMRMPAEPGYVRRQAWLFTDSDGLTKLPLVLTGRCVAP